MALQLDADAAAQRGAVQDFQLRQVGGGVATNGDVTDLQRAVDFLPATTVEEGVRRFIEWYRASHSKV